MRGLCLPFFLFVGCGDQFPCSGPSCPQLSGAYLVSWQAGTPQTGCPMTGPRPVNFNVSQQGNQLSVLVGGDELRGTLYDTYDFSLNGGRAGTAYTLRGRAVVRTSTSDAGTSADSTRLVGTLFMRTGTETTACELAEPFAADRL